MDFDGARQQWRDTGTANGEQVGAVDDTLEESIEHELARLKRSVEEHGAAAEAFAGLGEMTAFINAVSQDRPGLMERYARMLLEEPFLPRRIAKELGAEVRIFWLASGLGIEVVFGADQPDRLDQPT